MSGSVMPISHVGNMADNSTNDASTVAARISVLAHHTMNTAIGMLHVPLPDPCDPCKF